MGEGEGEGEEETGYPLALCLFSSESGLGSPIPKKFQDDTSNQCRSTECIRCIQVGPFSGFSLSVMH